MADEKTNIAQNYPDPDKFVVGVSRFSKISKRGEVIGDTTDIPSGLSRREISMSSNIEQGTTGTTKYAIKLISDAHKHFFEHDEKEDASAEIPKAYAKNANSLDYIIRPDSLGSLISVKDDVGEDIGNGVPRTLVMQIKERTISADESGINIYAGLEVYDSSKFGIWETMSSASFEKVEVRYVFSYTSEYDAQLQYVETGNYTALQIADILANADGGLLLNIGLLSSPLKEKILDINQSLASVILDVSQQEIGDIKWDQNGKYYFVAAEKVEIGDGITGSQYPSGTFPAENGLAPVDPTPYTGEYANFLGWSPTNKTILFRGGKRWIRPDDPNLYPIPANVSSIGYLELAPEWSYELITIIFDAGEHGKWIGKTSPQLEYAFKKGTPPEEFYINYASAASNAAGAGAPGIDEYRCFGVGPAGNRISLQRLIAPDMNDWYVANFYEPFGEEVVAATENHTYTVIYAKRDDTKDSEPVDIEDREDTHATDASIDPSDEIPITHDRARGNPGGNPGESGPNSIYFPFGRHLLHYTNCYLNRVYPIRPLCSLNDDGRAIAIIKLGVMHYLRICINMDPFSIPVENGKIKKYTKGVGIALCRKRIGHSYDRTDAVLCTWFFEAPTYNELNVSQNGRYPYGYYYEDGIFYDMIRISPYPIIKGNLSDLSIRLGMYCDFCNSRDPDDMGKIDSNFIPLQPYSDDYIQDIFVSKMPGAVPPESYASFSTKLEHQIDCYYVNPDDSSKRIRYSSAYNDSYYPTEFVVIEENSSAVLPVLLDSSISIVVDPTGHLVDHYIFATKEDADKAMTEGFLRKTNSDYDFFGSKAGFGVYGNVIIYGDGALKEYEKYGIKYNTPYDYNYGKGTALELAYADSGWQWSKLPSVNAFKDENIFGGIDMDYSEIQTSRGQRYSLDNFRFGCLPDYDIADYWSWASVHESGGFIIDGLENAFPALGDGDQLYSCYGFANNLLGKSARSPDFEYKYQEKEDPLPDDHTLSVSISPSSTNTALNNSAVIFSATAAFSGTTQDAPLYQFTWAYSKPNNGGTSPFIQADVTQRPSENTSTASLTPDIEGTYLIRCMVTVAYTDSEGNARVYTVKSTDAKLIVGKEQQKEVTDIEMS